MSKRKILVMDDDVLDYLQAKLGARKAPMAKLVARIESLIRT